MTQELERVTQEREMEEENQFSESYLLFLMLSDHQ